MSVREPPPHLPAPTKYTMPHDIPNLTDQILTKILEMGADATTPESKPFLLILSTTARGRFLTELQDQVRRSYWKASSKDTAEVFLEVAVTTDDCQRDDWQIYNYVDAVAFAEALVTRRNDI